MQYNGSSCKCTVAICHLLPCTRLCNLWTLECNYSATEIVKVHCNTMVLLADAWVPLYSSVQCNWNVHSTSGPPSKRFIVASHQVTLWLIGWTVQTYCSERQNKHNMYSTRLLFSVFCIAMTSGQSSQNWVSCKKRAGNFKSISVCVYAVP